MKKSTNKKNKNKGWLITLFMSILLLAIFVFAAVDLATDNFDDGTKDWNESGTGGYTEENGTLAMFASGTSCAGWACAYTFGPIDPSTFTNNDSISIDVYVNANVSNDPNAGFCLIDTTFGANFNPGSADTEACFQFIGDISVRTTVGGTTQNNSVAINEQSCLAILTHENGYYFLSQDAIEGTSCPSLNATEPNTINLFEDGFGNWTLLHNYSGGLALRHVAAFVNNGGGGEPLFFDNFSFIDQLGIGDIAPTIHSNLTVNTINNSTIVVPNHLLNQTLRMRINATDDNFVNSITGAVLLPNNSIINLGNYSFNNSNISLSDNFTLSLNGTYSITSSVNDSIGQITNTSYSITINNSAPIANNNFTTPTQVQVGNNTIISVNYTDGDIDDYISFVSINVTLPNGSIVTSSNATTDSIGEIWNITQNATIGGNYTVNTSTCDNHGFCNEEDFIFFAIDTLIATDDNGTTPDALLFFGSNISFNATVSTEIGVADGDGSIAWVNFTLTNPSGTIDSRFNNAMGNRTQINDTQDVWESNTTLFVNQTGDWVMNITAANTNGDTDTTLFNFTVDNNFTSIPQEISRSVVNPGENYTLNLSFDFDQGFEYRFNISTEGLNTTFWEVNRSNSSFTANGSNINFTNMFTLEQNITSLNYTGVSNGTTFTWNFTINQTTLSNVWLATHKIPVTIVQQPPASNIVALDTSIPQKECDNSPGSSKNCVFEINMKSTETKNIGLNINNTGTRDATNCNASFVGDNLPFATFQASNFNITTTETNQLGILFSKPNSGSYSTYIDITCVADNFGGIEKLSADSSNLPLLEFTISQDIEPGTQSGEGGGGAPPTPTVTPAVSTIFAPGDGVCDAELGESSFNSPDCKFDFSTLLCFELEEGFKDPRCIINQQIAIQAGLIILVVGFIILLLRRDK